MPNTSIFFGLVLIALGAGSYFASGAQSPTALIPAGFGAIFFLCGLLSKIGRRARIIFMHIAALFGLFGTLGGLGMSLPKLLSGAELARPMATWMQLALGVLSLIFLVLCIKSFVDARRARSAA